MKSAWLSSKMLCCSFFSLGWILGIRSIREVFIYDFILSGAYGKVLSTKSFLVNWFTDDFIPDSCFGVIVLYLVQPVLPAPCWIKP